MDNEKENINRTPRRGGGFGRPGRGMGNPRRKSKRF